MATHHILFNLLADDTATSDLYFYWLLEDLPGQSLHLAGKRGREHHRLPVRPDVVNNPVHLKTTVTLYRGYLLSRFFFFKQKCLVIQYICLICHL